MSSQPVFAGTYGKTRTERQIESLGPKPSWILPVPIVSRLIWELKYPRSTSTNGTTISYRFVEPVIVILITLSIPTLTFFFIWSARKKKKKLEVKESESDD